MNNDQNETKQSLFERIGGQAAVDELIDDFYERVTCDPNLARFFEGVSMEKLRAMQKEFFAAALGGPLRYSGAALAKAHARLKIQTRDLSRFTEHLIDTLAAKGIKEIDANEIVARIGTFSREILGESNVDG